MLLQVKASAGSGKTYALTGQFLSLLHGARPRVQGAACGGVDSPEYGWTDILAVTFTNKAATEMKERVVAALKKRALGLDPGADMPGWTAQQAEERLGTVLRELGWLNVRTIDSLLSQMVRLSALELHLPPDFEAVFDMGRVFDPLYDSLVSRAESEDGAERRLLQRLCKAYLATGAVRGFWPGEDLRARLLEVLDFRLTHPEASPADAEILSARLDSLHGAFLEAARDLVSLLDSLDLKRASHFDKFLAACLETTVREDPKTSAYADKPDIAQCLLKASKDKATPDTVAAYEHFKRCHAAFASQGRVVRRAMQLAPLLDASRDLLDQMHQYQRDHGVVLSALWPMYVRRLLLQEAGAARAFCRMGSRLRHLLIDEFQDTSLEQWEAMEPLAEEALSQGGGLFYVGDVKQAIYGWRGGDARLFDQVEERPGLAAMAGAPRSETLAHNWRSAREVVEFNNGFFGRLGREDGARAVAEAMLEKAPDHARDALAQAICSAFADARQELPPGREPRQGLVRLHDVRGGNKEDLHEAVKELLRHQLDDLLDRRSPREVAVLVRSNEQASLVSQWCIEWKVPVVSENSLLLAEHPVVRQLVAFLRFLDYPLDDAALWEFLSGQEVFLPASGLDPIVLDQWLAGRERGRLHRQFSRDFSEPWQALVQPFLSQAGLLTPYDAIQELVARLGVLERSPDNRIFVRRLLETAHRAEERGMHSLSTFLEFWDTEAAEEKVPLPEQMNAVRVMTIHKAKGLQFPVVLVPFHHFSGGPGNGLAEVEMDGRQVLAPLEPSLGEAYWTRAVPALCEVLNLLYVAWTRPEEELHCAITSAPFYERGASPMLSALRVLLEPYGLREHGDAYELGAPPLPAASPDETTRTETPPLAHPEPPRAGERLMAWLPRLRIFRSALEEENFEQRRRGTLLHRCLEGLRPTGDLEQEVGAALRAGLGAQANPHDPAAFAEDREELAREAREMIRWLLDQPGLPELLAAGRPEQPILDTEGNEHRVDLLARMEHEDVVVEYKTGAPSPEHDRQVRRYLRLLHAMGGRPCRGLLVYLDGRRIQPVDVEV